MALFGDSMLARFTKPLGSRRSSTSRAAQSDGLHLTYDSYTSLIPTLAQVIGHTFEEAR